MTSVGAVNYQSAAYVASYVTKKFTSKNADETAAHYRGRVPEYATMSRRPGIGTGFIIKYLDEIYRADSVIIDGQEHRPPKFYDRKLEQLDPDRHQEVTDKRKREAKPVTFRHRQAKELESLQRIKRRDLQ